MPTDSNPIGAIGLLLTALGLSSVSGLRAYLPLLAVAIGSDLPGSDQGHIVALSQSFQSLGSPPIIAILAALTIGEFFADKIPVIDHLSDVIHTVIRPASGAAIMAAISNPLSDTSPWLAALVGAVLSLAVHGVKAGTRPVVTATTVGHGNPVVSLLEDIVVVVVGLLAFVAPIIAFVLMVLLVLFAIRIARGGLRRLLGRGRNKKQPPQPPMSPQPMPPQPLPPPVYPTQTLGSTQQNAPTVAGSGDQSQWIWPSSGNAPTWPGSPH